MKLSCHDTSNQFDPTSSVAEHPGPGAVADGLALHVQTMQLAAHVQGPSSTHVQGSGGGKNQGRRQDSGGGGAHVTPELIDLDGPMMELVGVDPLLNIAIIFYPVSWTTTYN